MSAPRIILASAQSFCKQICTVKFDTRCIILLELSTVQGTNCSYEQHHKNLKSATLLFYNNNFY